ncbi:MAG: ATP-binding protein [Chloroflexi bacterium]|nr:ATP-binding protein [Chloroflexota bacterium]
MPTSLAERLSAMRRHRFVGRESEKALFEAALTATELPFYVLHVYGPGGVGKTTLVKEFASLCEQSHITAIYLDARNIDPSPNGFVDALRLAMGLPVQASPIEALGEPPVRRVILIDTYETLTPLDNWLREIFLPQLSENVLTVLAGRNPPAPGWRADPGWQMLIRTVPLRNLSPEESRAYLTRRDVPVDRHAVTLEFTHGHPLALSLVADTFAQRGDMQFEPQSAPDVIKMLVEQFVQKVPGPAHRAALEACALVRILTEALLAQTLNVLDAHELFNWLRGLSFIESGPFGLFPHDVAREALVADLRWRNPEWYAELHKRARAYYGVRLQQTRGHEQQGILIDYIFLHRDNPVVRPFFVQLQSQRQEGFSVVTDVMRENDQPALVEMVAHHEGEESARLAACWFSQQRHENTLVFRDADGKPAGFVMMVSLHQASPKDVEADPAAHAAWRYLQHHRPLRSGEGATLFRFWMAGDTYQAVSPIQSLIFVNMVRHYLTTPGLAYTFLPCANPDFWVPVFNYVDLTRIPEADYEMGGRHYGVYGHDWRVTPPLTWLAILAERETASTTADTAMAKPSVSLVALSQEEFTQAVRDVLRDMTRPAALRRSPLVRSRLVMEQTGASSGEHERAEALHALLKKAVESLQSSPRDNKLYRALYHTYIQPAATQEQAAEILDLPFSTFRRHLQSGVARVTELLWQKELGEGERG